MVGFFQYDSRAHLQLDGKALTLPKRVALSGSRYQGKGVTLRITKAGVTTLKHAKAAGHHMRADMKKGRNALFRPFLVHRPRRADRARPCQTPP
jgi:hypothetical protein